MKIEEVLKEENVGNVYKFDSTRYLLVKIGTFLCLKREEDGEDIDEIHPLCVLVKGSFEEVINWSKVPMDTEVLVSNNNINWYKRYFYSFLDGKYLCFNKGKNSTNYDPYARKLIEWEYCKLYQE